MLGKHPSGSRDKVCEMMADMLSDYFDYVWDLIEPQYEIVDPLELSQEARDLICANRPDNSNTNKRNPR